MNRRDFLRTSAIAAAGSVLAAAAQERPAKPNFVLIFVDDLGYGDVAGFGPDAAPTPNLQRMAEEGRRFTDFHVTDPICTPSRAGLLTGKYAQRMGLPNVLWPHSNEGLPADETTVAEVLQQQGYAAACIGKWHLGHKAPFLPTQHGFDYYYGIPYSNDMWADPNMRLAEDILWSEGQDEEDFRGADKEKAHDVPLMRNDEVIEYPADQKTLTKRYTEEALQFIGSHKDEPFFVYLAHTMPHVPLAVSEAFEGASGKDLYTDVVMELDWSAGQILDALKEQGLAEKTCVIFTSDNGPWLSYKGGKDYLGSTGGLRESKFSTYEGGVRVPCIAWWPGAIPAGTTCDELATTLDILPTFTALAGAQPPKDLDGHNIWPLLSGAPGAESPYEWFYYHRGDQLQAVRHNDWKLREVDDAVELYDLAQDHGEQHNLAQEHPEVVEKLREQMQAFRAQMTETKRGPGTVE